MRKILLLHGPNLNKLGMRDKNHYGDLTLAQLEQYTREIAQQYDFELICFQSNHEGALIDTIQAESPQCVAIMMNAGAFTHYSYALHDALLDTQLPVVEVHLSAIQEREAWRRHSVIAPACIKTIDGKKQQGYREAIEFLAGYIKS